MKYSETITIKQKRTFYFAKKEVIVLLNKERKLSLTNNTGQSVKWTSNDTEKVTVSNNGYVKGKSKGDATIEAKTADGKYVATCQVNSCEIMDVVSARSSGGSLTVTDGVVQYGSKLNWTFKNSGPEKVVLRTMQLVDGETNEKGNEMEVNTEVAAEKSVTKTTAISVSGIHLPVKCLFKFEYEGGLYTIEAEYKQ